ncbi:putative integrase/recombinase y4rA [Acrocarpospora pleiomorpha]|uniref:Putative integrase/recombinase y4rA n=1 Tax=Acrocarpospora pleiomorpha TaxID=90975 RepID=A0A5M3XGQ0_9ACTN|nr:tyrosine-type recombinase/integrase [Acrocarpospora pleiomorpha]GES18791.1 putative integrase/recombinase y4rA [Acrocarpospora pleiomorpha]
MVKAATDGRYPVRVSGPLTGLVHEFRLELIRQGFMPRTAQDHAYVLAHLSRWLDQEGLAPAELGTQRIAAFVAARRVGGCRRWRTVGSLRPMLGYLRRLGLVPAEEPRTPGPVDAVLERYRRWLERERRLGEQTVDLRLHWAGKFLITQIEDGRLELGRIGPQAVTAFVLEMSQLYAISSMKPMTSGLRSLLRFLFAAGDIDRDLAPVVPSVAGWHLSGIPIGADDEAVTALLASCNRSTAVGRRDFAVLLLMARLGLRAVEVARLRLEDIDWRGGELTVRGKGGRIDRMPLPSDVGGALADWLRDGRRPSALREVFTRTIGPDAPMKRQSIVMVPRRASSQAGIAMIGAHRLRHRVACRVLAGGGSLSEVAELLRHNDHASSAIYAKVDLTALAAVIRPWPMAVGDDDTA